MQPSVNLSSNEVNFASINKLDGRFYSLDEHYSFRPSNRSHERQNQRCRSTNERDADACEWRHHSQWPGGGLSTRSLLTTGNSFTDHFDAPHFHHSHCHHHHNHRQQQQQQQQQLSSFADLQPIPNCAPVPYRSSPPLACSGLHQDHHRFVRVCPSARHCWQAPDQNQGPPLEQNLTVVHSNCVAHRFGPGERPPLARPPTSAAITSNHHHHHNHFHPPQHSIAAPGRPHLATAGRVANADHYSIRVNERRLSSIIGSDSELCRRSPQGLESPTGAGHFSSSSASSSLSSLSFAQHQNRPADRVPMQSWCAKPHSHLQPVPRTRPAHPLDGLRLHRQGSSTTSEASFSQQRSQSSQQSSCGHVKLSGRKVAHQTRGTDDRLSPIRASGESPQTEAAKQATESKQVAVERRDGTASEPSPSPSKKAGRRANLAASGKTRSLMHSPISLAAASNLGKVSLAGAKRRLGFKQHRGLNSLSVHRSEEIFPSELTASRQQTSSTTNETSRSFNDSSLELADSQQLTANSSPRHHRRQLQPIGKWLSRFSSESPDPKVCFVDGLGLGQIVSRQALVSPYLGDIQLSLSDRRGMLEVEVIRLRQLQPQTRGKRTPAIYVKVYLMRAKKCLAKVKTNQISHTLDPLFQQLFIFRDDYKDCVLQVIVWANYGKSNRKSLMGLVQIHLDELDISNVVIGWYRLFNAPSMVASQSIVSSSRSLRQTLSTTKLTTSSLQ